MTMPRTCKIWMKGMWGEFLDCFIEMHVISRFRAKDWGLIDVLKRENHVIDKLYLVININAIAVANFLYIIRYIGM